MTLISEALSIEGMKKTEFQQLASYVRWAEERGVYYGNKEQFEKRHKRIVEWMDGVIELLADSNVRIAK